MKQLHVAACIIEHENTVLLLHRQPGEDDGDTWGLPAGKIEGEETPREAIIREVKEETGHEVNKEQLEFLGEREFTLPKYQVTCYVHRLPVSNPFKAVLNPEEHVDYDWVDTTQCSKREDLIFGVKEFLEEFGYTTTQ